MKKLISAICAIAAINAITACDGRETQSVAENTVASANIEDDSSEQASSENSEDESEAVSYSPLPAPSGTETFLVGLDGAPVYESEIAKLFDLNGNKISVSELTKENFGSAVCEGFCYFYEPTGFAMTNIDNPDKYTVSEDPDTLMFEAQFDGRSIYFSGTPKRYNVGDKISTLTVKKAEARFNSEVYNLTDITVDDGAKTVNGKDLDFPEIFFDSSYAEFDGIIEMTGYFIGGEYDRATGESTSGNLYFIPTDNTGLLPAIYMECDIWLDPPECHSLYSGNFYNINDKEQFAYISECGEIWLEHISLLSDELRAEVEKAVNGAEPNKPVKVKITMDGVKIHGTRYKANLLTCEILKN